MGVYTFECFWKKQNNNEQFGEEKRNQKKCFIEIAYQYNFMNFYETQQVVMTVLEF